MKLKKINHVGIVVNDINEAKDRYGKAFGIKSWYEIVVSSPVELEYLGEKRDCTIKLYVGGKGTTKVELLEAKGERTIYSDFLERRGEGIHHIMYNVKDLEAAVSDLEANGMKVLQKASYMSAGAKIRYVYIGRGEDDTVLELVEMTIMGKMKKGDMPCEVLMGRITGNYKKVK